MDQKYSSTLLFDMNEEFWRKYFITYKMNSTTINLSYFYRDESEKRGNSLNSAPYFHFLVA